MPSEQIHPRPNAQDAARRLLVLKYIVGSAICAPPREMLRQISAKWDSKQQVEFEQEAEVQRVEFWQRVRHAGLWESLSPKELEQASASMANITEQQQLDGTWRMESAQVLMWALKLIPTLPAYDTMASNELLKLIPSKGYTAFIQSASLRGEQEIDDARSVAELWHWRARTRQIIERGDTFPDDPSMSAAGFHSFDDVVRFSARNAAESGIIPQALNEDFPVNGKAYRDLSEDEWSEVRSISVERHFALNWLCGYAPGNRWDETPTHT